MKCCSSSCGSLSTAALGPMIVGPAISVDDWVPARPPKKPHLRGAAYQPPGAGAAYQPPPRASSPDLPPPSPPPLVEEEVAYPDEPLPPPPPEEFLRPNHSSHQTRQDKARLAPTSGRSCVWLEDDHFPVSTQFSF